MGQFCALATMRKAGALAGATLLGGLVLVGATAQAASAAATGIVTGSVTSASSGAPLGGICVYADGHRCLWVTDGDRHHRHGRHEFERQLPAQCASWR